MSRRSLTISPLVLVCSVCVWMFGACSSDASSELVFDSTTIAAPATVTTALLTSVPEKQPTPAPTTVITTTTTVEATTTTASIETIKAQVEADFRTSIAARVQCGLDPVACNYEAVAVPGSPLDAAVRDAMRVRVESNLRAVEGRGEFRYVIEEIEVDAATASVTACGYDDVVVFDVADPTNPDDDIVFNDSTLSTRVRWIMQRVGDLWRRTDGVQLAAREGDGLCDV